MSAREAVADAIDGEDQARADMYALLATLFLQPPSQGLLTALGLAAPLPAAAGDQALVQSWARLVQAAGETNEQTATACFNALFVSVGTPHINPNGSQYLAGFLMEKPLAALRDDLHALGLGRTEGSRELEDHLGALCEIMRLLIAGTVNLPARGLAEQRTFFIKHIAPWYRRCLDDIRRLDNASFYARLADFAQVFLDVEFEAFHFEDAPESGNQPIIASAEDQHA